MLMGRCEAARLEIRLPQRICAGRWRFKQRREGAVPHSERKPVARRLLGRRHGWIQRAKSTITEVCVLKGPLNRLQGSRNGRFRTLSLRNGRFRTQSSSLRTVPSPARLSFAPGAREQPPPLPCLSRPQPAETPAAAKPNPHHAIGTRYLQGRKVPGTYGVCPCIHPLLCLYRPQPAEAQPARLTTSSLPQT